MPKLLLCLPEDTWGPSLFLIAGLRLCLVVVLDSEIEKKKLNQQFILPYFWQCECSFWHYLEKKSLLFAFYFFTFLNFWFSLFQLCVLCKIKKRLNVLSQFFKFSFIVLCMWKQKARSNADSITKWKEHCHKRNGSSKQIHS